MKKSPKQIAAIIALIAIVALIIAYFVSAIIATPESGNTFFAFFFAIIAIPILLWLFLFCYGRLTQKHTIAEYFPENDEETKKILEEIELNRFNEAMAAETENMETNDTSANASDE
ncbi:MAG: hypothetical protein IJ326_00080 [Lachnospiraceae bacterium]|nr:hypothetical protein [Lachnospiraceae bacterium]